METRRINLSLKHILSFEDSDKIMPLLKRVREMLISRTTPEEVEWGLSCTCFELAVTHLNGCPLDFEAFAKYEEEQFWDELLEIGTHINLETGKLEGGYIPRCALSLKVLGSTLLLFDVFEQGKDHTIH